MRSPLAAIFLIVVVDVLAFTLIIPLLPFYAERFGATPREVGYLVSSFALCQLLAGPALGDLSDRVGRKPVLALSQLGTFAGFVVLACAHSLWMVFLARVIDGITAGNLSVAQAAISDVTTPEKRARGFAIIGVSFGIGFLIGPALSAWLVGYDVRAPIAVAAGLSLLSVVFTLAFLPTSPRAAAVRSERRLGIFAWGSYGRYLRRPELSSRLVQFFLFALSFVVFTSGFALFAERRFVYQGHHFGVREVGFVLAFSGVLGVILQGGVVTRLITRFGESRMVSVGFAFQAAGFAMLAWAHSIPELLAAATVSSIGSAPLRPALTSLVTRSVGPHEQGLVLGLSQSLTSIAQIVAPLAVGVLIGRGWLVAWALVAALCSAAGLAVPTRGDERAASDDAPIST